ncbi:MAG: hypothetical protein EOO03_16310, partial [Chitinophagaceae bacterium]
MKRISFGLTLFVIVLVNFSGNAQKKEELTAQMASQGKITTRRLFIGNKRGVKNGMPYDETGLDIRNRLG